MREDEKGERTRGRDEGRKGGGRRVEREGKKGGLGLEENKVEGVGCREKGREPVKKEKRLE